MKDINSQNEPIKPGLQDFLSNQKSLSMLKFITCGSVDDGKSTLIGRILFETQAIFEDQVKSLRLDSKKFGTQGKELDLALLVDGLSAEREQGITIDVAYRFFSTDKRKFIVADTPGHEQYTRNMITGASNADLAVILVDARKGLLEQTKRHSFINSLIGIENVVLAVNKMDLINYDKNIYENIVAEYKKFAKKLNFKKVYDIPVSALTGDNVSKRSKKLKWYSGPSLLPLLESIKIKKSLKQFTMPIQYVIRPNSDYRAYSGKISSGYISVGDQIQILPSGKTAKVKSILIGDKEIEKAFKDQSISMRLNKEIDISRGDVICRDKDPIEMANIFNVNISWLTDTKCFKGRNYIAKIGTIKSNCQIVDLKFKYDINTLEEKPASNIGLNEIANANISFDKDVPFQPYSDNKTHGGFILIDPITHQTIAAVTINHSLRRSTNIHKHNLSITRKHREELNGHKGKLFWFTGLSGSGKSTIADAFEKELYQRGIRTYILDGDNIRHGLNKDLGFKEEDRIENIRRVAEVSKLMVDAGIFVLASFISPYRSDREMVRSMFDDESFAEIYVNTSLEVAESRDPKGLYKKARLGKIPNFTGINQPYEAPENAEILLNTEKHSVKFNVKKILKYLEI
jgi:bifunctional enzyme CysN/CysC